MTGFHKLLADGLGASSAFIIRHIYNLILLFCFRQCAALSCAPLFSNLAFAFSLCSAFVYFIIFCRLFVLAEHHSILIMGSTKAVSDVSQAVPEGDKYPKA